MRESRQIHREVFHAENSSSPHAAIVLFQAKTPTKTGLNLAPFVKFKSKLFRYAHKMRETTAIEHGLADGAHAYSIQNALQKSPDFPIETHSLPVRD